MLQIGDVATRVGLSLRTIRHWDEIGLVVPSARSAGRFRLYTDADVERLLFVKSLKPLDLTLDQIRELVELIDLARADAAGAAEAAAPNSGVEREPAAPGVRSAHDVRSRLALYRTAADARIEALRAQLSGLESLSRELRRLSTPTAGAARPDQVRVDHETALQEDRS